MGDASDERRASGLPAEQRPFGLVPDEIELACSFHVVALGSGGQVELDQER